MPSPREIALTKNRGRGEDGFAPEPPDRPAIDPEHREPDYRANPTNPPDREALPARNLKGG